DTARHRARVCLGQARLRQRADRSHRRLWPLDPGCRLSRQPIHDDTYTPSYLAEISERALNMLSIQPFAEAAQNAERRLVPRAPDLARLEPCAVDRRCSELWLLRKDMAWPDTAPGYPPTL